MDRNELFEPEYESVEELKQRLSGLSDYKMLFLQVSSNSMSLQKTNSRLDGNLRTLSTHLQNNYKCEYFW